MLPSDLIPGTHKLLQTFGAVSFWLTREGLVQLIRYTTTHMASTFSRGDSEEVAT
jgi:hypothetical protein